MGHALLPQLQLVGRGLSVPETKQHESRENLKALTRKDRD